MSDAVIDKVQTGDTAIYPLKSEKNVWREPSLTNVVILERKRTLEHRLRFDYDQVFFTYVFFTYVFFHDKLFFPMMSE